MHKIGLSIVATTYGLGPYHPAIRDLITNRVWYWPGISKNSEDAAIKLAILAIKVAKDAAEAVANEWEIVLV